LGNSSNRFNFSQRFWRDDENGLSTYLNHASGVPQIVSEPQENGPPQKRNRRVIDTENPPSSPREAAARWEKARSRFLEARRISEQRSSELQKAFKQIERLVSVITSLDDKLAQQPAIAEEYRSIEEQLNTAQPPLQEAEQKQTHALRALANHAATRPGFFARLLQRQMYATWKAEHSMLDQDRKACEVAYANAWQTFDELKRAHSAKKNELDQIQNAIAALENERDQLNTDVTRMKAELDVDVPDADFLGRSNEEIQIKNVWFDKAASRLRDDVFEAAIQLHRAFIDAAADPIRQNLSVFVESFGTRSMGTPQKDALIADLWATFFLVVPVVSTTFASVHRMFSRLAPEALGWLLVDEAGQAVPQASVGAMMRTKRSVVVGDPLQIEPVVTLPNSLTEEICAYFGIDPLRFNAPEASIQTVADAASMF
ncbi:MULTISPECIES: AAA domain-containing protein, partial [unclassified Phaeobacter]